MFWVDWACLLTSKVCIAIVLGCLGVCAVLSTKMDKVDSDGNLIATAFAELGLPSADRKGVHEWRVGIDLV